MLELIVASSALVCFFSLFALAIKLKNSWLIFLITTICAIIVFMASDPMMNKYTVEIYSIVYFVIAYVSIKGTYHKVKSEKELVYKNKDIFNTLSGFALGWLLADAFIAFFERGTYNLSEDMNIPMVVAMFFFKLVDVCIDEKREVIIKKEHKEQEEKRQKIKIQKQKDEENGIICEVVSEEVGGIERIWYPKGQRPNLEKEKNKEEEKIFKL